MFRMLKVRPPHGWSAVIWELVIVVVGVLVALWAGQLVQNWEWKTKVAGAQESMRSELLSDNGPQIYQRAVMHPCAQAKLVDIRAAVEAGKSRNEISELISGYWLQLVTYDTLALDAATASDVLAHMPKQELDAIVAAYSVIPSMERNADKEEDDMARLHSLRRTGRALSQQESAEVVAAVEALRSNDNAMWAAARWALPSIQKLGPLDAERRTRLMRNAHRHYGACIRDLPANWPNGVPLAGD